ncbi:DNA-directed RNA polymerase [Tilletia horrida]|nr:DNA-directed RNA polymerase [Tilletia horrida]
MYRTVARAATVPAASAAASASAAAAARAGPSASLSTIATLSARAARRAGPTAAAAIIASASASATNSPRSSQRHRSTLAASTAAAAAHAPSSGPASTSRSYGNSAPSIASSGAGPDLHPPPPPPPSSSSSAAATASATGSSRTSSSIFALNRQRITRLPSPLPADIIDRLELFRSSSAFESFATNYEEQLKRQNMQDQDGQSAEEPALGEESAAAPATDAGSPSRRTLNQQRAQQRLDKAQAEFNSLANLTSTVSRKDPGDQSSSSSSQATSSHPLTGASTGSDPFFFTESEALFPTSRRVESLSILKACLATGMIGRAEKLFDTLRHEYHLRSLTSRSRHSNQDPSAAEIPPLLYDLMLDCYLHKAASLAQNATADPFSSFGGSVSGKLVTTPAAAAKAAATTTAIRVYVQRALALFGMMNSQRPTFAVGGPALDAPTATHASSSTSRSSVDPTPSANTLSIMMRGIVRLKQMGAYPRVVLTEATSSPKRRPAGRPRARPSGTMAEQDTGGDIENESLFANIYSRIPSGLIQTDCPALDVILASAQRHNVSLERVFQSSIFQIRMPHELQEQAPQTEGVEGAAGVSAATSLAASPTPSSLPQPSVTDVIQEASATAERMGDASLAAQLRAQLEEVKGQERGIESTRESSHSQASLTSAVGSSGMTPEELQATIPIVQPVLTSAHNNPGRAPNSDGLVEPFNLTNLKENLSVVQQSRAMYSDPYDRQEWLELSSIDAARKQLEHAAAHLESLGLRSAGKLQSKPLQVFMWNWFQELQPRIKEDLQRMETQSRASLEEQDILPFIKFLPINKLALIPILEVMRVTGVVGGADGAPTARLLVLVGKAVEAECQAWMLSQNAHVFSKLKASQQQMRERGLLDPDTRKELQKAREELGGEEVMEQGLPRWTQAIRSRVGGFLVQRLLETAKVHRSKVDKEGVLWEEDQPAFYSTYQYIGGRKLGVIKLNDEISQRMETDRVADTISPRHLPMLVPPRLWETPNRGGYLTARQSLMRYKDSAEQGSYLRAASQNNGLEPIMAGLDVLGQTAWTINTDVLRVLTELWNRGESLGKLPAKEIETPTPERPDNYDTDLGSRAVYLQRVRAWALESAALHSQRCDVNYKLEIARAFVGERFYLPHNIDFRGRAYPIPPHLHHLGSDLSRGLLLFADAKPLQATGLRWLRVHLANLYGFDKASFGDRVQFALDNEENIRKSAEDPINFRWWAQAEEPFQCLAACVELAQAMAYPEGPEAYPCRLPVHQDGTCNGLQHYAALGGDMEGAKQVNLSRGDAPADVYTGVAELVMKRVNEDAAAGSEIARVLQGKVTRKVVKQTVMTTVYGVTLIGAKDQVMRRLSDRKDVPAEKVWEASAYLARLIISSIGDLFSGAQAIQNWLHESASLIAKSIHKDRIEHAIRYERTGPQKSAPMRNRLVLEQMTSVIWQTPLGLPVVQPYRRHKKKQMATAVQTVFIHDPLVCTQVAPAKQASAFPPNFVHSLDATHMMLTALECHSAGLTFASVHDSYWTHACDIDTMSDIIRDTFVRLHSQDILARLREEFLERYKDHYLPVVRLKAADRARLEKTQVGDSFVVAGDEGDAAAAAGGSAAVEAEITLDAAEASAKGVGEDDEAGSQLAADGGDEMLDDVPAAEDVDADGDAVVDAEAEAEEANSSKGDASTEMRRGRKKDRNGAINMRARFVELSKMIRPLPAKGTFDVSETKKSLYFFS